MTPGLAAVLAGLLLASAPPPAEPLTQTVEGHRNGIGEIDRRGDVFVHRASGYVFPLILGEMPARKTYSYGAADGSVYYTLNGGAQGDAWLSLYAYPALTSLADEADFVEQSLLEAMPGVRVERPAEIPPPPAGVIENWYEASIEGMPVITGFRLLQAGEWTVKVRLTIPVSGGEAALRRAGDAIAQVPWSIPAPARTAQTRIFEAAQSRR